MGFIAWIFLALVSGLLANLLIPGSRSRGLPLTCLIGAAGALFGGWAAGRLFHTQTLNGLFNLSGWLTALTGAAILLLAYYALTRPGPHPAGMPAVAPARRPRTLRAVWQAEIELELDGVRVPGENRLPGANSFKDCAAVLTGTRSACAGMALGHAVSGFDAALTYAKRRKQLASFQIIQQRLVRMLADVTAMQLYCVQIARLDAAGKLAPTLAGLAKLHNTSKARVVLADARDMLGGNGILLDFHVIRHMADIESIHTFEGTETIQTLIVGRDITGIGAFS